MGTVKVRTRWLAAWVGMLLVLPGVARTVSQVTNPRQADSGWVTDHANVIDSATEQRINRTVDALQAKNGAEIAVVTVEDTSGEDTKPFATALFNLWKIGKAGEDSGVLVLLNMGERRIEVETGYGAETVLTDSAVGRILDSAVIPMFKAGRFGEGLANGVVAMAQKLGQSADCTTGPAKPTSGGTPTSGTTTTPQPLPQPTPGAPGPSPGGILMFLGAGFLGAIGLGVWFAKSAGRPVCAACNEKMTHLDDDEEDEFLDPLQKLEETVGGVDYHVWQCPQCAGIVIRQQLRDQRIGKCPSCSRLTLRTLGQTQGRREVECQNPVCNYQRTMRLINEQAEDQYLDRIQQLEESLGGIEYDVWVCDETDEVVIESQKKSKLRIDDCPACGRRTMRHTEHLIRSATRWHDGLRRHEYQCLNLECGRVHTRDETIPRVVVTQTSSSSWSSGSSGGSSFSSGGGSSFGGGSSGGGGAGRSF